MTLNTIDIHIINFFRRSSLVVARLGLFIVFFWFGILKVFDMSPASPLVQALFEATISFMDFPTFLFLFGIFECIIGIMFLLPKVERIVIPLLAFHLITTMMPLFLLTEATWTAPFVPTLEGQYIIKNVLIVATAIFVAAHVHPWSRRKLSPL
ncbi:MAG: hypothetical protein AAB381_01700 [Patescibacteria group bacterium]